jgi:hypothetical protein
MIGGRTLSADDAAAKVKVTIDGRAIDEIAAAPGFFLRFVRVPEGALAGAGAYARLSIAADLPRLAIEQFDAQSAGRIVFGFGKGWHEREYNPVTGRSWRWMSEQGVIPVRAERRPMRLSMQGETEGFSRPTRISIRIGDRPVAQSTVDGRFSIHAQIPAELLTGDETEVVVESDQFFVPAERSWRTRDRRRLALRVYDVQLTPAS